MNIPRLSLLISSILVMPLALVVATAVPAVAEPPSTTFGSHVSSCAAGTGFSREHNPSHHRGSSAPHDMSGMHCSLG